jgi:hypothetical protein
MLSLITAGSFTSAVAAVTVSSKEHPTSQMTRSSRGGRWIREPAHACQSKLPGSFDPGWEITLHHLD